MTMAHDPTRHWPLGVGPENTKIPGAAWLELLDGQAFPVVGAGAMVWNGTMWVPVSTQNRLPVEATLSGSLEVVQTHSGVTVGAGASIFTLAFPVNSRDIGVLVHANATGVNVSVAAAWDVAGSTSGAAFQTMLISNKTLNDSRAVGDRVA